MSRIARAGALLGTSVALAAALGGVAHAAPTKPPKGCYVIVYSGKNFTGQAACIMKNRKDMSKMVWGNGSKANDSVSSVKVDKVCDLFLYRDANYLGNGNAWAHTANRSGVWRKIPSLAGTAVGDNKTSSIKINCYINT